MNLLDQDAEVTCNTHKQVSYTLYVHDYTHVQNAYLLMSSLTGMFCSPISAGITLVLKPQ